MRSVIRLIPVLLACIQAHAQIITADPFFPTEDDSVIITYDASRGNEGLKGYTGDVYAHTGVITNQSSGPTDWKHAPVWGDNSPKYKLDRIGTDLYQLAITPAIREYYGLAENETVLKLAFVFRSEDKTREGKTDTGGDIFYDVYESGLNLKIIEPSVNPLLVSHDDTIPVEAYATDADSMLLLLNDSLVAAVQGTSLHDTLYATQSGKNRIRVIAKDAENTISDSICYFVKGMPAVSSLPGDLGDGINYINDSTVTLVLFAPGKEFVFVIGDFNNWELDNDQYMNLTPDGDRFWITLEHLSPGKEYIFQYLVDGNIRIADPYTEKVSDPWNDQWIPEDTYPGLISYPEGMTTEIASVFQTDREEYQWSAADFERPPAEELVIYELLIRDFTADHTYRSLIDTLDYLENLGINAIELMPVNEFEGNLSWGYNPTFYFAPDKYYGPENDLKAFIDECHTRGMAVILDMVLNHSFGQSPMVRLYWDAANNRPSEDNPWFNPVPKHDFNVGYDFNHESEETKRFTNRVTRFWLEEYHVDGYRFDLSKGFTQKNTLGNTEAWGHYDASRVAIWESYADSIRSVDQKCYIILEHFADNDEEQVLTDYGMMVWGNENYNYSRAGMGWNYDGKSDFSWGSYKDRAFTKPNLVTYMESHDEQRQLRDVLDWGNYYNPNYNIRGNLQLSLIRAELCAAFFFTIPGPKMVWQFGELGYDYSINFNGRTGEKPIRWDYYQEPARLRLYQAYSSLIGLKRDNKAFNSPDYAIDVSDTLKTIHIHDASMDVTVIGNFDVQPHEIDPGFTTAGTWYEYFTGDSLVVTDIHAPILLEKSEYRIYTSANVEHPQIIDAPVAGDVYISGTAGVGETLTGIYTYNDRNGDPEGISEYQWYRGMYQDGSQKEEIAGADQITHTITNEDWGHFLFFEVIPVAQSGTLLTGTPAYATMDIATGMQRPVVDDRSISIFPNPSSGGFHIRLNATGDAKTSYEIYDALGGMVFESGILLSRAPVSELYWNGKDPDGNPCRPGIYLIRISAADEIHVARLVIMR